MVFPYIVLPQNTTGAVCPNLQKLYVWKRIFSSVFLKSQSFQSLYHMIGISEKPKRNSGGKGFTASPWSGFTVSAVPCPIARPQIVPASS